MNGHESVARQAAAHLRSKSAGTGELARVCCVDPAFLDAALAPLVDAGKLMRINAFRNGAAEFDYRFSATWVPADADFELCRGGGHAPVAAISPIAPPAPGPLSHLNVAATPAHVARRSLADGHAKTGKRGANSKAARDSLARAFNQSPQSLGWAVAPVQPATESHPPVEQQEQAMPEKTRKPRSTKADSPQFQICALLAARGDLSRDELLLAVDCERQAFHNALYQAKHTGRIVLIAKTDKYRLTAQGRTWWADAAADPHTVKAAELPARDAAPRKTPAPAPADVAIAPIQVVEKRPFRCAVYSDGGFGLTKGDQTIELDAQEHAQMLHYLERMAEQAA